MAPGVTASTAKVRPFVAPIRRGRTSDSGSSGDPTGCRVLRLPQWPTLQLSLAAASAGCAGAEPATCVACPALRLDRWPTSPARIGVLSFSSTGGKHPICIDCCALPIDRWLTFQLALASILRLGRRPTFRLAPDLILQLGSYPTSGSHRLLLQPRLAPSAAATFGLRRLPPVCHTGDELPTRIGFSVSSFTGFDSLGLRRAPLPPAGPLMHPLL